MPLSPKVVGEAGTEKLPKKEVKVALLGCWKVVQTCQPNQQFNQIEVHFQTWILPSFGPAPPAALLAPLFFNIGYLQRSESNRTLPLGLVIRVTMLTSSSKICAPDSISCMHSDHAIPTGVLQGRKKVTSDKLKKIKKRCSEPDIMTSWCFFLGSNRGASADCRCDNDQREDCHKWIHMCHASISYFVTK